MIPWNPTKAKVQARLAVQRLRTLQEKKEAQAKSSRRDIATLLEKGKLETAKVKVENIINEDIYVELLELLELHCELIIARFGLLDQNTKDPDPRINESVCCIIHAAPRTELKELNVLRDMLMRKFGREFSIGVMENREGCVSDRVMNKLRLDMPSPELVDAYLYEIAKGYGIKWTPSSRPVEGFNDDDKDATGGKKEPVKQEENNDSLLTSLKSKAESDVKSPKLPDLPPTEDETKEEKSGEFGEADRAVDDFESLARRFEALKRR